MRCGTSCAWSARPVGAQPNPPPIRPAPVSGSSKGTASVLVTWWAGARAADPVGDRKSQGDVAELITRRLSTLAHSGLPAVDEPTVRAVVRQAVRPAPVAADLPADPALTELRRVVDDFATTYAISELMLEVAPAYLSDTDAADLLAPLCEAIGENLEHGLAAGRYALSGNRCSLHGAVL